MAERKYSQTHPWITFELNLQRVPFPLWIAFGEAKSKCEHIARTPLRPTVAKEMHKLYLAKGVRASTAIEGNTLSEAQVLQQIDKELSVPPSQEYLKQEVDNLLVACKLITRTAHRGQLRPLTAERICNLNKLVLRDLPLDEGVVPGEVTHAVTVGGYRGAPREDCYYLLERLCDWLNGTELNHPSLDPKIQAIIKSIVAHVYLAWIHPFGDGNGRTARLLEFRLLLEAGVPSPAAHLLSNHYNQTRSEYYRQLSYSSKSGGDLVPFILYAVNGLVEGLQSQLSYIRNQQLDLAWRSVIFNIFKDRSAKPDVRQRQLIWEISKSNTMLEIRKLAKANPAIALLYVGMHERTLSRDLEELDKMNLLVISKDKKLVRAKKELVLTLLPEKRIDGVDWTMQQSTD